jgi:formylglycine-generating enzyme required for sulfatase activity
MNREGPDRMSGTVLARNTGDLDVLAEIQARIQAMQSAAHTRGAAVLPPLLMLGTSERVGSNWLSDTLRPVMDQHNEPFRQQLGAGHPLSALNADAVPLAQITGTTLGTYGRHWLVTFVTSKYSPARQGVKETSLYFALPALLALFPASPVAVLSRSPLGVGSSFRRSALFTRWDYRSRYQQMVTMTRSGPRRGYAVLVPDDDPPGLVALTRLVVLNAVLLAAATRGRDTVHIAYEAAVRSHPAALSELARVVPELTGRLGREGPPAWPCPAGQDDGIYSTTVTRQELVARLSQAEASAVEETAAAGLAAAAAVVSATAAGQAAAWLAGGQHYRLEPADGHGSPGPARPPRPGRRIRPRYVRRGALEWRNVLVTNAEFAALLNELNRNGLASSHGGAPLLACEMPQERGGRLHYDPQANRWRISDGYQQHPVYWVTWIGAAAFAAWEGARLPRRAELADLTASCTGPVTNAGYRFADVTPVAEPRCGTGDIHHLLGNLQVWCSDGPDEEEVCHGPAARWLHGAAWNTPGTPAEIHRPRWRHLAGSSRGVGIRLVRDGIQRPASASDLASRLSAWVTSLSDRSRPLAEADQRLIRTLDVSQADAGLGAHVAPGPGKPRRG